MATATYSLEKGIRDLTKVIDRLKAVEDVLYAKVLEIMNREMPALIEINRRAIEAGENQEGKRLRNTGYSPNYAAYKARYARYKNTAYVDLKAEGDFIGSIAAEYVGNLEWKVIAKDPKYKYLAQYNPLGIQEDVLQEFCDDLLGPELVEFLEEYLNI